MNYLIFLLCILNIAAIFGLSWLFFHYKETLKLLDIHSYFLELLDYNNLSLELHSKESMTLDEEAMLYTMRQQLKEKADTLGLDISFPENPNLQD